MSISDFLLCPVPYRALFFRYLRRLRNKYTGAPYLYPTVFSDVERPEYGYALYHAAQLGRALGQKRISAIEFGVAGGAGVVNLEFHAKNIMKEIDIGIDIFGFDLETGLPAPTDYRDLPFKWFEGAYKMDREALESRLEMTKLIIGDVRETIKTFYDDYSPAPIGAIFFDLDFYSSTMGAFEIFNTPQINYLPRVMCYFDDILGTNPYIGELLAIDEFNESNPMRKIVKPYALHALRGRLWNEKIFQMHDFEHPQYNTALAGTIGDGMF